MSILSQIRYQDLLDILICSYVVFRFYVIFRGTNVFTVLIGLAFLWLLKILAVWMGLIVTSFAIQAITALAAIIIIVVFRNEIRRTLQATNIKTLLWGFPRQAVYTPSEAIVDAVFELSKNQVGGLVVLPGSEDLKDYIHSGIPFEGLVSREAIVSIFWKDNPLHDGAAVISGSRILEARAILPLTKRKDLPSHYGTRHRAAAGLAETTDALVIAISEERGQVFAVKGAVGEIMNQRSDLARAINNHTGAKYKKTDFLKNEKLKFGLAALVSVIFISGAWVNLTKGLDTLITLRIPIEYKNQNPEMEIISTSVDSVRLFLKGSEALLQSIRPERLKANIDLTSADTGSNTFGISKDNLALPPGVTLTNVQPPYVAVALDVQVTDELPVQVDWVGKLREDLILESAAIFPQTIRVKGGSLALKETATIYTKHVSLDDLTESGSMAVALSLVSQNMKIFAEETDTVTVTYVIKKRNS